MILGVKKYVQLNAIFDLQTLSSNFIGIDYIPNLVTSQFYDVRELLRKGFDENP